MNWTLLIAALIAVESGGDPAAVGDGGRSVGILQIQAGVVADLNALSGTAWVYPADARDPLKARLICRQYIELWLARKGWPATAENAARVWNGGPNGPAKAATLPYWRRVQAAMDRQTRG